MILRIDNGVGAGDFHLGDSIASGNYMIRAYTNSMRNFGEIFFFEKEIVVENQKEIKSLNQSDYEESNEKVDVQFFPEGGPLIENVYTLLGFKAVNSSGYGCNVTGRVFSSSGDTITSFTSTHLGMGSFFFLPKKDLKYFATGYAGNGIPFRVELPTVLQTGYSLKVSDINKDYFCVTIKTNQETLDQFRHNEMVIVGNSHNSLCITAKAKVWAIDNPVILPKKEFPEGIASITLMDTTGKTYCERVYYVHPKENYRLSIIPDCEVYTPRQKVTLQISIRDTSDEPVSANLSVSVVDGNQIKGFEKNSDISSYLFLESEIRGYVEQPFYYFDTTVTDRYQALDNLLLTQGWRNFVWNNLPDTAIKFDYPIETGFTVSGRLRHVWSDKPIADANISMALSENVSSSSKFTQTDSAGKYHFYGLSFTGPQNILLYAADKKDMGKGLILLDSIFRDPAPVNFNQTHKSDTITKNSSNNIYAANLIQVADNNEIFELHESWAQNIVVALIRIMGKPVGVIANNPMFFAGALNVNASDKASRFIRFCDAFNIPLLTFADVPGYMPGTEQEWSGIIRHGAKLLHAYAEATVPKITVVTRKDYGGAYIGMCSKQLGADYVMAWPTAEIAVMGAEGACNIIYRSEIKAAADPAAKRADLIAGYKEKFNNPYFAASMGIIEEIIHPHDTRKRIIALLEALQDKKEARLTKKHNNIPL